ncbi:MAG: hypothetical protein IKN49_07305 [Elusimicrobiaceae bacterium]|nr:hypothetical protein [Elusimicrobiaceae bacterium]
MAAAYRGRLQISKAFWGEDSPSSKIPDGIFLQAGLAVFAFRAEELYAIKQKHRSAFLVLAHAKQFACCPVKIFIKIFPGQGLEP